MGDINRDGGPAFPRGPFLYGENGEVLFYRKDQTDPGMSLRDWFAAHATDKDVCAYRERFGNLRQGAVAYKYSIPEARYRFADAMLAERNRQ